MKALNRTTAGMALLLALLISAGCEWSTNPNGAAFNSDFNSVDFSGVYRGLGNTPLVSDFSGVPAQQVSVTGEQIEEGDGASTTFAGSLAHADVVPASITIEGGGFTFKDADGDGTLVGSPSGSGSIIYGTGAYTLDFGGSALAVGEDVRASYVYTVSEISGGAGSSGGTIVSFTVFQEGNLLSILDNLGASYSGNMGSISSSGIDSLGGSDVLAQFTAEGVNAAGLHVTITGVFTGVQTANTLTQRVMDGTYIEDGGVTGDVLGAAPSIDITTPDITVPGTPGSGG